MAIENHTKVCKQCGEDKPLDQFRPNKKWLRCECRNCERANVRKHHAKYRAERTPEQKKADAQYQSRYKKQQRQKLTDWEREWRKQNKERANDRGKRYYEAHKAERSHYHAERYERKREHILMQARMYRARKPSKRAEINARRSALLARSVVNDFTDQQWQELLETFNKHCAYCLEPSDDLTREHLIPITRGGNNTASNIVPACRSCNSRKHTKTLLEFVMAQFSIA